MFAAIHFAKRGSRPVGDNTKRPKPTAARPAAKVWFAVDVEARTVPTAEPTKQDQRAPIKMVGGRAWSPGIVGEQAVFSKDVEIRDQAPTKDRPKNRRVRFAVESSTSLSPNCLLKMKNSF